MRRNIVFLLVLCGPRRRVCTSHQAVGQSVRAQQPRRSDHELRAAIRSRRRTWTTCTNRAPARAVPKAEQGAAVVAAKPLRYAALRCAAAMHRASAAILPEDRADVMYHGYDGGGLEVSGPSVLVRKGFKDKVSVWANYYVDMISSASIDVVATASPYKETRKEYSGGIDYLSRQDADGRSHTSTARRTTTSRNTARFGISQDFFGDLTTLGDFLCARLERRDEERRSRRSRNIPTGRTGASTCRRSSRRTW